MTKSAPERHYESANEEFSRRVKELYQLAEKMNLFLQIKVRPKHTLDPKRSRQPGED